MTAETIEGTAIEVIEPIRSIVVAQPGQALVAQTNSGGPAEMIGVATALANALKDIVEQRRLYTTISGKKFPQVEAWMTIGRMDNVVAREAERPIRNDDGSYEAFVELVRLSDGMVIGRASALCGTPDDKPWASRSEPARRSMAVTRATSRAFRQQYSWIMALAGYEPTPADEMPDERGETHQPDESPSPSWNDLGEIETLTGRVSRQGTIRKGGPDEYQMVPRQTPEGTMLGFRLEVDTDKAIPQCVLAGVIGTKLMLATDDKPESLIGTTAKVAGILYHVRSKKGGSWYRLHVDRFENAEWVLTPEAEPAPVSVVPEASGEAVEPESVPMFDASDMADVDKALGATA